MSPSSVAYYWNWNWNWNCHLTRTFHGSVNMTRKEKWNRVISDRKHMCSWVTTVFNWSDLLSWLFLGFLFILGWDICSKNSTNLKPNVFRWDPPWEQLFLMDYLWAIWMFFVGMTSCAIVELLVSCLLEHYVLQPFKFSFNDVSVPPCMACSNVLFWDRLDCFVLWTNWMFFMRPYTTYHTSVLFNNNQWTVLSCEILGCSFLGSSVFTWAHFLGESFRCSVFPHFFRETLLWVPSWDTLECCSRGLYRLVSL